MKKPDEIKICLGSSCFARGNREMVNEVKNFLEKNHISEKVVFRGSHCLGNCENGPNMKINDDVIGDINKARVKEELSEKLTK